MGSPMFQVILTRYLALGILSISILACSHGGTKTSAKLDGPIRLEISKSKGHIEVIKYRYISNKSTLNERKIRVKRDESVDFTTKSTVVDVLPNNNCLLYTSDAADE